MNKCIWKIACTGMLFLGIALNSCNDDGFRNFNHLVNSHTGLGMIDTVTIKVSNMISADSVNTYGRGAAFSGTYSDPQIGDVVTKTYIEFTRTTDSESDRYARFDSVTLVLRPNGNYYGDTTQYAAFKISRLLDRIEKNEDGGLYSTSKGPDEVLLTEESFRIKVKDIKNNEFEVKLPDDFGEWLFDGILRGDDEFKGEDYLKTFSGLSVGSGTGSACVHGLNIQDTACMIRIYYHVNTTSKQERKMEFKANPYNSFCNLHCDRIDPLQYTSKDDPVPSSETNDMGVIMSGFPMFVRLEFPYLNELKWLGQIVKIQKATLYVRPVQRSFDIVPLPPKLNLYYFNPRENKREGTAIRPPSMGNSNVGPMDGNLPANYQSLPNPYLPQYTFDVTDYIADQIGATGYNRWALSLLIPDASSSPEANYGIAIQRLVFGNQNYWYKNELQSRDNRIKLEVIYIVYND